MPKCSCCGVRKATINKFNDWVCAECDAEIGVDEPIDLYWTDSDEEEAYNSISCEDGLYEV